MQVKKRLFALGLGLCVLLTQSCAAAIIGAGAGAGAVAYVKGELQFKESYSVTETWRASLDALRDLEFRIQDQKKDATGAVITALTSRDTRVKVTLERVSEDLTEVRIRVGVFGDRELSELIREKIEANLPSS